MRVLHINQWDSRGGAAIAASRLHEGLLGLGVDSWMLVARAKGHVPNVVLQSTGLAFQKDRVLDKATEWVGQLQKEPSEFGSSVNIRPNNLISRINAMKPDLVHLHWVGGGMLRIEDLPKINCPIVWTLHDMWPFCGSEHYNLSSLADPGNAPTAAASRPWSHISKWNLNRKMKAWRGRSLITVSPSEWMQQCARQSDLWHDNSCVEHRVVANGLDTEVFKPKGRADWLLERGLNSERPTLAFGAFSLHSKVKGGEYLLAALRDIAKEVPGLQLLTFGSGQIGALDGLACYNLGTIDDPHRLADLYSFADVMLVPSKIESFGQTASEALACGTPVVCFDTSGLKDVVPHKTAGYRARAFELSDFVEGIKYCLSETRKVELGDAARKHALNKFQISNIAVEYATIYREIIRQ